MSHGLRAADPTVTTVRTLLKGDDIARIFSLAELLKKDQAPLSYDNTLRAADELPFGLTAPHQSVFLHRNGSFAPHNSDILGRIVNAMLQIQPGGSKSAKLGVRTIELHSYRTSGGLLDPEHCDMGSALTLSCLLVDPELFSGGIFVTFDNKQPRYHRDLACGDAIVFDSELRHNVTAITRGMRHSLVVELWEGPDNEYDRHS